MSASCLFERCRSCGPVTRLLCTEPCMESCKHMLLCYGFGLYGKLGKVKINKTI